LRVGRSRRVDALGSEPARSFSAAFDLRGDSRDGALGLSTPLGSMLAQARWSPSEVSLRTPQGARRFADLDSLTREVLGESVPVEAWFDWLRGRPWPAAPSTPRSAGGFEQLGWAVDVARLGDGRVVALREQPLPQVTVRIQLEAL
jgi:outer membrane lipoprotein LolB